MKGENFMNPDSKQKRIAFGYNRGPANQIEYHPGQAPAVKLIYNYYLEGVSLAGIAENLESMGAPSPLNKPTWGKQTISNILSNPHYIGGDGYPPIISKEDFDKVQEIKKKK